MLDLFLIFLFLGISVWFWDFDSLCKESFQITYLRYWNDFIEIANLRPYKIRRGATNKVCAADHHLAAF